MSGDFLSHYETLDCSFMSLFYNSKICIQLLNYLSIGYTYGQYSLNELLSDFHIYHIFVIVVFNIGYNFEFETLDQTKFDHLWIHLIFNLLGFFPWCRFIVKSGRTFLKFVSFISSIVSINHWRNGVNITIQDVGHRAPSCNLYLFFCIFLFVSYFYFEFLPVIKIWRSLSFANNFYMITNIFFKILKSWVLTFLISLFIRLFQELWHNNLILVFTIILLVGKCSV